MFIRTTRVKKGDTTYTYAQLVESYRREDGRPTHKVIASLGRLSELEVDNLKLALQAAKDGVAVAPLLGTADAPVVSSSRDFMNIAVILEMSRRLGLTHLLASVLDGDATSVPNSKVVLGLIAHRLLAPGSKLAAVGWFERTAIPELLDVSLEELNNSRIHRVLDTLDQSRPQIQLGVAALHSGESRSGHALFVDVSDTWFEGRGPDIAQTAKTKEGAYKKKVGIVLSCNEKGQPIRWDVVQGRRHDAKSMSEMAKHLVRIPGLADLPVVFDRAMGKKKTLQELTDAGVHFLTLMTKESYDGYAREDLVIPGMEQIEARDRDDIQAQAEALGCVQRAGFTPLGRRLWGKSLGVRRYQKGRLATDDRPVRPVLPGAKPHVMQAMAIAEEIQALVEAGATFKQAYEHFGIDRFKGRDWRKLLALRPEIRDAVRAGQSWASIEALKNIAKLHTDEQPEAFAPYRLDAPANEPGDAQPPAAGPLDQGPPLRLLLAFDPEAFAANRAAADAVDKKIREELNALNNKLAGRSTSPRSAELAIAKLLAKHEVTDCYEVHVTQHSARLQRNEEIWQQKRRADGFRLFAFHPDLRLKPERVINLYSEKNAVEVDFHVIKSVVKIRPVHHATEAKVRAHVDLCVLALAVERALRDALPSDLSAPAALEKLETMRLTTVSPNPSTEPTQVLTLPNAEQTRILRHLNMLHLTQMHPS